MADHRYPLEALFGRVLSPFEQFLRRTTAGGIVLIVTTIVALGLATALGADVLHHFWARTFNLTPWVAFVVIPIFALANAGIDLGSVAWGQALSSSVTIGVLAGLVIGKFVGISLFSWIAVRLGLARLPSGVQWKHLMGAAWLAGIGFTMSLFIAQLAFRDPQIVE